MTEPITLRIEADAARVFKLASQAELDQGSVLLSIPALLEIAEVLTREKFDKYLFENCE